MGRVGWIAFCVVAIACRAVAQEPAVADDSSADVILHEELTESIVSPTTQVKSLTTTYEPGDGVTVSMLNGASKLKLFGQFSAIGIFSTDRPFSSGLPLLLLPPSPTGLNTNTFDLHARQSGIGASFSGPEVLGFTPGAFFLGFIQNDVLTSDAYGLLPYQGYGDLKN
jgi:hypothetical protein